MRASIISVLFLAMTFCANVSASAQLTDYGTVYNPFPLLGKGARTIPPENITYEPVIKISLDDRVHIDKNFNNLIILLWSRDADNSLFFRKNWPHLKRLVDNNGYILVLIQLYGSREDMDETARMFCQNKGDYDRNALKYLSSGGASVKFECQDGVENSAYSKEQVSILLKAVNKELIKKLKLKSTPTIWFEENKYDKSNMGELDRYFEENPR